MHVFELLADPTRRRIVELLARQELPVVLILDRLGSAHPVSQSAVSHHLRTLRDTEFVEVRAEGAQRLYRLKWDAMDRLDAAVEELWVIWENRVGWPYAVVTEEEPPARLHRAGRRGLRGRTRAELEPRGDNGGWWSFLPD